jgi:hemerythrin-like metal-binding protein
MAEKNVNNLEWKDEFLLGIPAIDLQHRRIFDCFVVLAEEAQARHDGWVAEASFAPLAVRLREHFSIEEGMMRSFGYPELARHIEQHRQFEADLLRLAQESQMKRIGVSHEMSEMFQKWHQVHIMTSDRHYVNYFAGPRRRSGGRKHGAK